jgi:hypothetical protein
MDRAIFDLQASVEATSLYILLCALLEQEETVTLEQAERLWNGTPEGLLKAAEELVQRGVLDGGKELSPAQPLTINSKDRWF